MSHFKPISGTYRYVISEDSYVYNVDTGRRLQRRWAGTERGWYTTLFHESGITVRYYHNDGVLHLPHKMEPPDDVSPIPNYPNYGVTRYGAVWRIGGSRNVRPHIVTEHERGQHAYVQIRNKYGKRHNKRVDHLVEAVWG